MNIWNNERRVRRGVLIDPATDEPPIYGKEVYSLDELAIISFTNDCEENDSSYLLTEYLKSIGANKQNKRRK